MHGQKTLVFWPISRHYMPHEKDFTVINSGAIAEHVVGQEFISYTAIPRREKHTLWHQAIQG